MPFLDILSLLHAAWMFNSLSLAIYGETNILWVMILKEFKKFFSNCHLSGLFWKNSSLLLITSITLVAISVFIEKIKYTNSIDLLYRPDGSDLISKDLKQINKNDFLMGILTAMTVSSKDMTNRFLQVFNSGFKKSPFFYFLWQIYFKYKNENMWCTFRVFRWGKPGY